ncbi:MAG TPA: hypothetical protein VFF52_16180 [Isosphaeraceae bacterium]|nr:hypothetical protein [Isosphaeraceae bacterium]
MVNDDRAVWKSLTTPPPRELLMFIADEVWRRTRAPFFQAERARLALAVVKAETPEERRRALEELAALHEAELTESRHQAALVSQALIETAPEGYEAWCRAAMARLQLVPLGAAEIDRCLATARSVGEELRRSTLTSPDGSPDGALGVASPAA